MAVTVEPSTFTMVDFDAAEIAAIAEDVVGIAGIDGDVVIAVDETAALGRSRLTDLDPIRLEVESGAFEDPRVLRAFSRERALDVIGRYLTRAADRRSGFADAPPEHELDLPHRVAWDVTAAGRIARAGHPAQRQRWLYTFRTRHGFTDLADGTFDALWDGRITTWRELADASDRAAAANPGRLDRKSA